MNVAFVCGCPRSGTTALAAILNEHPQLCIGVERYKHIAMGPRGAQFLPDLFTPERFVDIRPEDTNIVGHNRRLKKKFESKYEIKVIGEKTPRLYTRLPFLKANFPDAKLIFIFRDPYEVALSWERRAENTADNWPAANGRNQAVVEWVKSIDIVAKALPEWPDAVTIIDYARFFGTANATGLAANIEKLYGRLDVRMRPENVLRIAQQYWRAPKPPAPPEDPEFQAALRDALAFPAVETLRALAL